MNMIVNDTFGRRIDFPGSVMAPRQPVVVLVSDNPDTIASMEPVCAFLDLRLLVVAGDGDLTAALRTERPVAVIADVEGEEQDGFHAMKLVARFDLDMPVLLLTDGDPALMGAADAIQDLWGLTAVTPTSGFPLAGQLVGFLFTAGRKAGCMRLVPV
jgi:hypothetical protein